ncbi:MAG: hypothetical protein M5U35_10705 [Roseovarius sp.]|nr:hypothetical protein [Roseovarius sp.]
MSRRDTLLSELALHFPDAPTFGHRAGMHLSLRLPGGGADATRLERRAALRRIGVYRPGSGGSWISPDNRRHRGHLLLGYAAIDERTIRYAIAALAACMSDAEVVSCP